jgi:hypothetical protein
MNDEIQFGGFGFAANSFYADAVVAHNVIKVLSRSHNVLLNGDFWLHYEMRSCHAFLLRSRGTAL